MKTALIVGSKGQDGRLLSDLLKSKDYEVCGLGVNTIECTSQLNFTVPLNILKKEEVFKLIKDLQPSEIYFLAALHHSSEDVQNNHLHILSSSWEVNVHSLHYFLEAVRLYSKHSRLFYASSSFVFGTPEVEPQDEKTPMKPITLYGITKAAGMNLCRFYRESQGVFASSGILYNHESPYRKSTFLTKKIIQSALQISRGEQDSLIVGNLDAEVDWGYAGEYVEAMHLILNQPSPEDFILASGRKSSVRQFIEISFGIIGLDWQKYVKEDRSLVKRKIVGLVGNPTKLREATGWYARTDLKGLIEILYKGEEGNKLNFREIERN